MSILDSFFMRGFNYCFLPALCKFMLFYNFVKYLCNNWDNGSWKSFCEIGCNLSCDSEPEGQLRIIDFTSLLGKYISSRQLVGSAEASGTGRGLVSSLKTDAKCWLKALAIFNDPEILFPANSILVGRSGIRRKLLIFRKTSVKVKPARF